MSEQETIGWKLIEHGDGYGSLVVTEPEHVVMRLKPLEVRMPLWLAEQIVADHNELTRLREYKALAEESAREFRITGHGWGRPWIKRWLARYDALQEQA